MSAFYDIVKFLCRYCKTFVELLRLVIFRDNIIHSWSWLFEESNDFYRWAPSANSCDNRGSSIIIGTSHLVTTLWLFQDYESLVLASNYLDTNRDLSKWLEIHIEFYPDFVDARCIYIYNLFIRDYCFDGRTFIFSLLIINILSIISHYGFKYTIGLVLL